MTRNQQMKAVVFDKVGPASVLCLRDMPRPVMGDQDVLVRVKASALNHIDLELRTEDDDAMPMPHILGTDVSGEIVGVGRDVVNWSVGDDVLVSPSITCGTCINCVARKEAECTGLRIIGYQVQGGYAEYIAVPSRNLLKKPNWLSFEEAAAIPLTFMTAHHALFGRGGLVEGAAVLIMGASSGVGSAAIQLARSTGANIFTTVGSAAKADKASKLGLRHVLRHDERDWKEELLSLTDSKGVDVVLEHFGGVYLEYAMEVVAKNGRVVTCGSTVSDSATVHSSILFRKQASIAGSYLGTRGELENALALLQNLHLRPIIDSVFEMKDAAEAHRYLESRNYFGKIVLRGFPE